MVFLAFRPIRHHDIPSFFVEGSVSIVSNHQLMLVNEHGYIPEEKECDFRFDTDDVEIIYNDDDEPISFGDDSSDDDSFDDLEQAANKRGFSIANKDVIAAAEIVHVKDDVIFDSMEDEFKPLLDVYHSRVTYVAALIKEAVEEHIDVKEFCYKSYYSAIELLNDILTPGLQTDKAFSSYDAKLMFVMYPIMCNDLLHGDFVEMLTNSYVTSLLGIEVYSRFDIDIDWEYYGHYPRSILFYLQRIISADDVQEHLRKEFALDTVKEGIFVDESLIIYHCEDRGLVVEDCVLLPLLKHWSKTHPIFVKAKHGQYASKKILMTMYCPFIHYSLNLLTSYDAVVKISDKSTFGSCLYVGSFGYNFDNNYVRNTAQYLTCLGFALKAVLCRGAVITRGNMQYPCVYQSVPIKGSNTIEVDSEMGRVIKIPDLSKQKLGDLDVEDMFFVSSGVQRLKDENLHGVNGVLKGPSLMDYARQYVPFETNEKPFFWKDERWHTRKTDASDTWNQVRELMRGEQGVVACYGDDVLSFIDS